MFTDLVHDIQLIATTKSDARHIIDIDPQLRKKEHEMVQKEYLRLTSTDAHYMSIA